MARAALEGKKMPLSSALAEGVEEGAATDSQGRLRGEGEEDSTDGDKRDLDWSTVLKRTFESYIRGERPNMYGEWIDW
jgi:DDB1- and CUL4-associated factor 13